MSSKKSNLWKKLRLEFRDCFWRMESFVEKKGGKPWAKFQLVGRLPAGKEPSGGGVGTSHKCCHGQCPLGPLRSFKEMPCWWMKEHWPQTETRTPSTSYGGLPDCVSSIPWTHLQLRPHLCFEAKSSPNQGPEHHKRISIVSKTSVPLPSHSPPGDCAGLLQPARPPDSTAQAWPSTAWLHLPAHLPGPHCQPDYQSHPCHWSPFGLCIVGYRELRYWSLGCQDNR